MSPRTQEYSTVKMLSTAMVLAKLVVVLVDNVQSECVSVCVCVCVSVCVLCLQNW